MDLKVKPWLIAGVTACSLSFPLQGLAQYDSPQTAPPAVDSTSSAPPATTAPPAEAALPVDESSLSYTEGPYIAVMGTYLKSIKPDFKSDGTTEKSKLDHGYGGTILGGYRKKYFAIELGGVYSYNSGPSENGFVVHGLLFPLASSNGPLSGLYASVGGGLLEVRAYPNLVGAPYQSGKSYSFATYDAGVGDLYNMRFGNFKFALRGEVRYRYGERKLLLDQAGLDYAAPRQYHDVLFNVGIQIPLVFKHDKEVLPEEPTIVVPVADSDGDGVVDSLDQCPNTPHGTKVDVKGCPLPPKPVCKSPVPGERLILDGCGTGDVIVLNGVNFEFNKDTLTLNAKAILDQVATELGAHPDIKVELAGHTDSKGSAAYNQKLSQKRAEAVRSYFIDHGIDADRMSAVGYGMTKPVASNDTEEGRAQNRRTELRVTAGGAEVNPATAPTDAPENAPATPDASVTSPMPASP